MIKEPLRLQEETPPAGEEEKKEEEKEKEEKEKGEEQQQKNSITGIKENPGSLLGFFLVAETTVRNLRNPGQWSTNYLRFEMEVNAQRLESHLGSKLAFSKRKCIIKLEILRVLDYKQLTD